MMLTIDTLDARITLDANPVMIAMTLNGNPSMTFSSLKVTASAFGKTPINADKIPYDIG